MTVAALHTLYAIVIDTASTDLTIDEISSFGLSPEVADMLAGGDGSVDNRFVAAGFAAPTIACTTQALATVLATCGISGFLFNTGTGLQAFFQSMDEGGVRKTGSNHIKLTAAQGLLVPRTLDADQGGARLQLDALLYSSDGTTAPVAVATGQALVGTPDNDEQYVAGPVTINGTTVNAVQGISIDFGLDVVVAAGDGQVYPTFLAIQSRQPVIRIRTLDVGILSTIGMNGVAQGATDSVVYLQKVTEGGTRASGAGSAVSFTVDDGRVKVANIGGDGNSPLMAEIEILPVYDGSNAVLAINTADAIP